MFLAAFKYNNDRYPKYCASDDAEIVMKRAEKRFPTVTFAVEDDGEQFSLRCPDSIYGDLAVEVRAWVEGFVDSTYLWER